MIKYAISKNARIMFIGINPHHGSYNRGIPFSNNKMFWYLLNRSGIINEPEAALRQDDNLRYVYKNKFIKNYKLNFTNIITRPSRSIAELRPGEEVAGRKRILNLISRFTPNVVCFIGKVTYEKFLGHAGFDFGWQNDIFNSKAYLMHFPIRGRADIRVRELKEVAKVAYNGAN